MHQLRKVAAVAFACCLFCSCAGGTNFSWESARQVKVGMPEAELVELMGRPTMLSSDQRGVVYNWVHYNPIFGSVRHYTVIVRDGRVVDAPSVPTTP